MIEAMADNHLVHLSPPVYGIKRYRTMIPHLGFGRKVNFIEYHVNLFARQNFACLQDIVDSKHGKNTNGQRTTENHLGWQVDYVMPHVCKGGMGIIDAMKVFKFAGGSYSGKQADIEGKAWKAENHWEDVILDETESLGPLKGNLLPGDPQCDGVQLVNGVTDAIVARVGDRRRKKINPRASAPECLMLQN